MSTAKKELAVAALENGTVIDHIPARALFKAVRVLGLENSDKSITIGANLASERLGKKGIIKVADTFFDRDELNRIAIIAPTAVVNTIRNYEVADKRPVRVPEVITGIVRCNNPKCITNNEPMTTRFHVSDGEEVVLHCHYCNRSIKADDAEII